MTDLEILVRDKYDGNASRVTEDDNERLLAGEPLAYVIGWIPFLGLRIDLSSRPLIPRPETEWWTEQLIKHLQERFGDKPFRVLDLCAGSGCIGLAMLRTFPNAHVSFGELVPKHCEQIQKNIQLNGLDASRSDVRASDLFRSFDGETWDIIAINPPYIPESRASELDRSVTEYEPHEALFAGERGMDVSGRIIQEAKRRLSPGELWLEADIENIDTLRAFANAQDADETVILNDQYGRQRVLVSYFP